MTQPDFNALIVQFRDRLQLDQSKHPYYTKETVYFQTGRKYVKFIIGNSVRYFVEKSTGNIYGAKSRLAPNLNHYFGKIQNADKWDWMGFHGVNINDDTVRLAGSYGAYQHYMPI